MIGQRLPDGEQAESRSQFSRQSDPPRRTGRGHPSDNATLVRVEAGAHDPSVSRSGWTRRTPRERPGDTHPPLTTTLPPVGVCKRAKIAPAATLRTACRAIRRHHRLRHSALSVPVISLHTCPSYLLDPASSVRMMDLLHPIPAQGGPVARSRRRRARLGQRSGLLTS